MSMNYRDKRLNVIFATVSSEVETVWISAKPKLTFKTLDTTNV